MGGVLTFLKINCTNAFYVVELLLLTRMWSFFSVFGFVCSLAGLSKPRLTLNRSVTEDHLELVLRLPPFPRCQDYRLCHQSASFNLV